MTGPEQDVVRPRDGGNRSARPRTWQGQRLGLLRTGGPGRREEVPAVVIGGAWGAVLLVLFGAPGPGLVVGGAALFVWLLWRFLPQLGHDSTADADRAGEPAGEAEDRPVPAALSGGADGRTATHTGTC